VLRLRPNLGKFFATKQSTFSHGERHPDKDIHAGGKASTAKNWGEEVAGEEGGGFILTRVLALEQINLVHIKWNQVQNQQNQNMVEKWATAVILLWFL
jgi:hypothetical protein